MRSSVTRPVTDRVVPSRSMLPVGLAYLAAVITGSRGVLVNCPSLLLMEVTSQPLRVKILEYLVIPGFARVVGSAVTSP